MKKAVLLVNPNRMKPPIAPLGFEFLAPALRARGFEPYLLDLAFTEAWEAEVEAHVSGARWDAILVSVRNIDDAFFASRDFILDKTAEIIRRIRQHAAAPLVLGGIGFSIAPCAVLEYTGADYGIAGDGEEALPALLECVAAGASISSVPGAVWRDTNGVVRQNGWARVQAIPAPDRRFADNPRYFAEGGQLGFETKRGCASACTYCVEPAVKGNRLRLRDPQSVVAELRGLLDQGLDVFHTCDSEFNLPKAHAHAVCESLVSAGLGERLRWYAYAHPLHFDADLARRMARAGCVGINFGVDHADPGQLRRLGRAYGPEHLRTVCAACREAGLETMFDLLLGGPGETRETLEAAIAFMRAIDVPRVGLSCGVRVYPNTHLAEYVRQQGPLAVNPSIFGVTEENEALLRPVFYVEAGLGADIHAIVSRLVDGDARFLHADPAQMAGNYNYNGNSRLAKAIRNGERGAYWDILRRIA